MIPFAKANKLPPGAYRLMLTQDGARRGVWVVADGTSVGADALLTTVVPTDLLVARSGHEASQASTLVDGTKFVIDAHGIWWTEPERVAFRAGKPIPWALGVAPHFAPK